ncbi:MAG: hypothetical protein ABIQ33_12010 [Caldimonas sp.]
MFAASSSGGTDMTDQLSRPAQGSNTGSLRFAVAFCLAVAAVLALSAFVFVRIVSAELPTAAMTPSSRVVSPFAVLPTVPEASDVLPALRDRDEPEIATHGG